ncbi:MAG: hypothetical protein JSW26_03750 [Desulfobacterales bacterium]|nr:MAG: hypothetical protein JSW26_03750 [Desulfobacterales bacterium]
MATYLKKAKPPIESQNIKTSRIVKETLADIRLRKYFPAEKFDFDVYKQKSYV